MRMKKWICGLVALVMVLALLPGQVIAQSAGPALAEGNHEQWIDRIADLPDYAQDFYAWLEENATADGALADPTLGQLYDGKYVYQVETVTGTVQFTYASGDDMQALAQEACRNAVSDISGPMFDYVVDAYGAFDRDHPEVFWLSGSSNCGYGVSYGYGGSNGIGTVNYTMNIYFYLQTADFDIRMEEYRDTAVIAAAIEKRDQDIARILADCPTDAPTVMQLQYLNKVLTETNAYNSAVSAGDTNAAAETAWKSISALSGSTGTEGPVCEGYARAFKVLCDELGIPSVLTEGYAISTISDMPEAHMWNYVQLDGSWYAVDVTWNDPVVTSAPNGAVSGWERETWLLLGSDTKVADGLSFIESHQVRNVVNSGGVQYTNGPVLEKEAYAIPDNLMDVAAYRSGDTYTAPEKDGYVFAGWFTDAKLTRPLSENVTEGYAYARFVDEDVLSVKWQITMGTTAASAQTDLRLLTSVNDLNYRYVSFRVICGGVTKDIISDKVYEQIWADGELIGSPAEHFGNDATYFMAYTLRSVPNENFDNEITIIPGWCTLDGTFVTGNARSIHVSDGF